MTQQQLRELKMIDEVQFADCRWYLDGSSGAEAYSRGHIPNAIFVDLQTILSDPSLTGEGRHPLPSEESFITSLQNVGLDPNRPIVAYDDAGGAIASRLWWMASQLGLQAAVLNGGIQNWIGDLETGHQLPIPNQSSVWVDPQGFAKGTISLVDLIDRLNAGDLHLLDARSRSRYLGEPSPHDPRSGHIPGAKSLPSSSLLTSNGSIVLPQEAQLIFTDVIGNDFLTLDTNVVASCGSGVSACHLILVSEHILGIRPLLYVGSFSQWSRRSELKVVSGAEPGHL